MPTIERDDVQLHYQSEGKGEAVLLLQGVGLPSSGWQPQQEALSQHYHCLAPDNRGIGQSTINKKTLTLEQMGLDALAILDAEGIQGAHVVGHSMGGLLAQQVALLAPSRIKSLSLLCTFWKGQDAAKLTLPKLWIGLRCHIGTKAMRRKAFLEMVLTPAEMDACDPQIKAQELSLYFGRDLAIQPPITLRQVSAMARQKSAPNIQSLHHIPTWVLSGSLDVIAHPAFGRELAKAIGGRFEEWPDAAHGLTITRATQVNDALHKHFASANK